jgi:hypothetical protein
MSTTQNLNANVPLVNVPFVDMRTGMISESWFLFLIQLWQRTGADSGTALPAGLTLDDVLSVEETFAPFAEKGRDLAFDETPSPREAASKNKDFAFDQTFAPLVARGNDLSSEATLAPREVAQKTAEMIFAPISVTGAAEFNASMLAWFDALPTTLPAAAGVLWNNGGTLAQS